MPRGNALIQALYDAYNAHDLDAIAALHREDATHVDVAAGRPKEGRSDIIAGLATFFDAFPDAHWAADAVADNGRQAFGRYLLTGTLHKDLWSFTARAQQVELPGVHVFEYADGLITGSQDYWDAGTFRRQMTHNHLGESA